MQCGSLIIANSDMAVRGGYYGDTFQGICSLGYVLSTDGEKAFLVTCQEGLVWNSTSILCQREF